MINRVVLVGRLTRDIDLRKTPNGASVVQFTIACNRRVKQQGQPDADFISCVAWNRVADLMAQYLHKGALIGVEGRIQTRSYDDRDGKRVYVTEVVADSVQFLESRGASQQQTNAYAPQNNSYGNSNYGQSYGNNYNAQPMCGYMQDERASSFDNDFAADTLDIASDDLPF